MYLVWYGFERMFVEGLRTDSLYLPFQIFGMDIRVSQVLSFAIFVTGIVILIINRHKEEPFYADYRVLYLDADYQYALIGSASSDYLWILSRTPQLEDSAKEILLSEAVSRGYDINNFIWVKQ